MESSSTFKELNEIVGTEGYKEILSSVSIASLNGAKFIANKTADKFKSVFDKASQELVKNAGNNEMKISKAWKLAKNHHQAVFFKEDFLKTICSSKDSEGLYDDAKNLVDAVTEVKRYILEVETFNEKQLNLLKKYTGITKTADAISVLQGLDDLKYPTLKFPHKENVMLVTNILPRGKVFSYNTETAHCDIGSGETSEDSNKNSLSGEDIVELLKEVEKLNNSYKAIAKGNQEYIAYLKKFNIVIKESFEHLDKIEDALSPSVKRDLLARLHGDKRAFGLYTGFLPKVVNYVDGYIDTLTSYLISKIN